MSSDEGERRPHRGLEGAPRAVSGPSFVPAHGPAFVVAGALSAVRSRAGPAPACRRRAGTGGVDTPRSGPRPCGYRALPPSASYVLVDVGTGNVLAADDEHLRLPPASLTKY